jgi:uncharacterized protein
MTPETYWVALLLFHAVVLSGVVLVARRWHRGEHCGLPLRGWAWRLARDTGALAVLAYAASVAATVAARGGELRRLPLGDVSSRLMGQALFGEAIVLGLVLAVLHARIQRLGRAIVLAGAATALLAVYVEAYRLEPHMLRVRRHTVDTAPGAGDGRSIRILHLTDIQTPVIGAHEERALRTGLEHRPDLIVLTGDYVQDALGRPTQDQAAADLRALMARIGFGAPLGVFATNGDAGPPCRTVFAGTAVRCLVDETVLVVLPGGDRLAVTGLARGRGRDRDPQRLGRILSSGEPREHQIVISHAPDFVDSLPAPVDLVLAGHTHGGQVVLPFFGPPRTAMRLPRRYAGGLHEYRGTPLHVSRGVGMERGFAPPVRFLCPPEICLLDVRFARS